MSALFTVVGYTTTTTSRIQAVFDAPGGSARLTFDDGRQVRSIDRAVSPAPPYGLAVFDLKGLTGPQIRYAVSRYDAGAAPPAPDALLQRGHRTFRTLPEGPLRIGLVSCNDIQSSELPKQERGALWRKLHGLVAEGRVDMVVHAGDQIYGDRPPVGWDPREGHVGAYRRHYVANWSHPDVASVLGSVPNVMMWDDHEIYDGWGSNDTDDTEAARSRFRAAAQAFGEFQASLNPPDVLSAGSFGWLGKYGDIAILAVDARSKRDWKSGSMLGRQQLDDLELRLNELAPLAFKHLFVVVGTPLVHVPLLAAEKLAASVAPSAVDDLRDGWTASNNREECRRFLMSLMNFAALSPKTQVTLVGGDVHVGTVAQIDTRIAFGAHGGTPRLYQVTSSGIARPAPKGAPALLLQLIMNGGEQELFNRDIVGRLRRISGAKHKHCVAHRNFAVLDTSDGERDWDRHGNVWVRFYAEDGNIRILEHQLTRSAR